jgi:amino acid adenylation domain-containing protein
VTKYLLPHYLEQTVSRYPGKTAVVSGSRRISYEELWQKSGRLANHLLSMGFTPRCPVGIYLDKSVEAVVSLFAVMKAGGMYIPLDSFHSPPSRITRILASSATGYLVSDSRLWAGFCSSLSDEEAAFFKDLKVVLVDGLLGDAGGGKSASGAGACSYDDTLPEVAPGERTLTDDDIAYILYTSGSTGVPKGVMLTHRNATTFVDWALSCFRPGNTDVFSNMAPLHFDLSVFDIHVSLSCGASVHLVPNLLGMNPRALLSWMGESGITYFYSVPSVWVSLLSHAGLKRGDLPALSHVLFAGEVFPPAQLKALMGLLPNASYYNLYGPTETNVCTWHEVKSADEIGDGAVPIGRACGNTEIVVLKDNDEPASVGEEGELFVKGPIVTKGYYRDPQGTADAFRKSPLPVHRGALLYRTGDRVRVISTGTYEYVGRGDLMVKCSGYRIEVQEVELALLRNKAVQEAVVVPVCKDGRASSIAAYITVRDGRAPGTLEIKEFLAGILPTYMIPDVIERIEEIPRNANGKADRRLLAERANGKTGEAA